MEVICDETLRLVQQASAAHELDLSYTIEGLNIRSFYELNCGGGGASSFATERTLNLTSESVEQEFYDPEYFSHTYRAVGTFFQSVIFLIGLLGNVMVVVVVAKTKSMHSPTNCYLVSLAVADIIVLLAAVPNEILSYYLIGGKWLYGEIGCSLFVFSQNLGINASTLSLTAFTVERYIAICHPMKAQTICTVSRAKRITAGVWLCSIVYCSPWLALTSLTKLPYKGFDDVQKCTFKLSREAYTYYYLTDFFVFYVVPLLLSVVLYSLIAVILFQSQNLKATNQLAAAAKGAHGHVHANANANAHSGSAKFGGTGKNGCSTAPSNHQPSSQPQPLTVDSTKTNAGRVQVVKMLIMIVVIFAVLWLPYRGMLVYNSFASLFGAETFMDLWFLMLVKTCIYINSAINPILYNAMSSKFRQAFSRTLFCGRGSHGRGGGGASYRPAIGGVGAGAGVGGTRQQPHGQQLHAAHAHARANDHVRVHTTYSTATLTMECSLTNADGEESPKKCPPTNTVVGLRQNHSSRKRSNLERATAIEVVESEKQAGAAVVTQL